MFVEQFIKLDISFTLTKPTFIQYVLIVSNCCKYYCLKWILSHILPKRDLFLQSTIFWENVQNTFNFFLSNFKDHSNWPPQVFYFLTLYWKWTVSECVSLGRQHLCWDGDLWNKHGTPLDMVRNMEGSRMPNQTHILYVWEQEEQDLTLWGKVSG